MDASREHGRSTFLRVSSVRKFKVEFVSGRLFFMGREVAALADLRERTITVTLDRGELYRLAAVADAVALALGDPIDDPEDYWSDGQDAPPPSW